MFNLAVSADYRSLAVGFDAVCPTNCVAEFLDHHRTQIRAIGSDFGIEILDESTTCSGVLDDHCQPHHVYRSIQCLSPFLVSLFDVANDFSDLKAHCAILRIS
ncbi:hypothetical protein D3C76_1085870 [compost metagenome]